jgi:shikimate dehydrogenase
MTKPLIGRETLLCMSLSARPSNFGTRFHNRLYELTGLDYVYKAFTTQDLPGAIRGVRALGIRGCAVSMPFKEAVIPLLDGLKGSAAAIDSVNTIVNDDGRLTGYNTDYSAVKTLVEQAGLPSDTRVLLRGSGGMGKAVATALRDAGLTHGTVIARNPATGRALADSVGWDWAAEVGSRTAGLLGMEGADAAALAFEPATIAAADVVLDAVALPPETPLLRAAQDAGKRVITGAAIGVLQAVEQFVLYTGVTPTDAQIADAAAVARG